MPPFIVQFTKFVLVGGFNTLLDFGILNLLSYVTGIYGGWKLAFINIAGFSVAVTSSYFLNKYWTFKATANGVSGVEFFTFLLIAVVGFALNSLILVAITTFVAPPPFGFGPQLWENVAKACATVVSMAWNFTGYKFIVFRHKAVPAALGRSPEGLRQ
ncbi:MAG: GtrA family protein [bacterium]|nr:GtrA family protein [bacterium]MDZ4296465.1 GtrA family protein [Patescibacteria group bacterium]